MPDGTAVGFNEGRIRPSLIEASAQRLALSDGLATRVEFDPPSLRPGTPPKLDAGAAATRVEFDPPSLRQHASGGIAYTLLTTRVEFDPPSLRQCGL